MPLGYSNKDRPARVSLATGESDASAKPLPVKRPIAVQRWVALLASQVDRALPMSAACIHPVAGMNTPVVQETQGMNPR